MHYIADLGRFLNILGRERAYAGRGRLITRHRATTGYCMELYYWLHGSSELVIKCRGQDYVEETMAVSGQVANVHVCVCVWRQVGWMLTRHRDRLSSSSFTAWSSRAQSVSEWAFSLLAISCLRLPRFESCMGRVGWMLTYHKDGLSSSSFLAWSSIAQSVCQRTFSLLAIWCLRPLVRILHSPEEDNLSPFDSNL